MISGISENNRKLLDNLARNREGLFSIKDAAKILHQPEENIRKTLAYLARKGWLSRIKQGLYIIVPIGATNPQEHKEHPWIVANRVFAPCYIGGWSAAEYWEFTDQIFNSVVVVTLRKLKNTHMKIQGTDYVIKCVNKKYFENRKSVWFENVKIFISDPLQTIVDILDAPYIGGGIRHVADIMQEYFNSTYVNDDQLCRYIKQRNNKTIYKRLGFLIDTLKIGSENLKTICKQNLSLGYSLLDPKVEAQGVFNSKWNLRINVRIR
ncbi:MAG TPA: type IV toxin-antitoxin system AbiEi family antitoxin domain-containing protein [Candidatus Babeliales bacterium]|nr:type IV toxin-antitoxin system AbiEi family antitoxin domain-containing protein [Candidatus Babeliales bacterium]